MKYGVINVYKEAGMTSFQVVYQIRKLTGEKKCGHTGTLDPDATGVLPVCIGKATKLVDFLMDTDKQYRACLLFGRKTDTQDLSGNVLEEMDDAKVREILNGEAKIKEAFSHFTGTIRQLPPMYSAVKVEGVKLVDAARKGKEIERKLRTAEIKRYEALSVNGFETPEGAITVDFTVDCSKGTYIRTLCEDIGSYLGVPACMASLERTRTASLSLDTAKTLEEIRKAKEDGMLEALILPTDRFLMQYPALIVSSEAVKKLAFGNHLTADEVQCEQPAKQGMSYRVYDAKGTFYAVYQWEDARKLYKCEKMFIEEGVY